MGGEGMGGGGAEEEETGKDATSLLKQDHHEHDEAKQLLARGESMAGDSAQLEALVRSLREVVEHHVREEEAEIFPRAREVFSAGQLEEIGTRLEACKKALVEQGMREMVEA